MANDFPSGDIQALWRDQQLEAASLAAGQVRKLAETFQSRIRRRNRREYAGAAVAILGHAAAAAIVPDPWIRLGAALVAAGVLYVCYQLHRRASAEIVPERLGLSPVIDFHRAQLERQRDALRGVWSWYALPVLPGLLVVLIAGARGTRRAILLTGIAALIFGAIVWLNRRGADRLQQQLDRLDSIAKGDKQ